MKNNNIHNPLKFKTIWSKIKDVTNYIIESPKIVLLIDNNFISTHNKKPVDYEAMYNQEALITCNLQQKLDSHEQRIIVLLQEHKKSADSINVENDIIIQQIQELGSKPIVTSVQQGMNSRMLRSLVYTPKSLTVSNTARSMPYQPNNRGYQSTIQTLKNTKTHANITDIVD